MTGACIAVIVGSSGGGGGGGGGGGASGVSFTPNAVAGVIRSGAGSATTNSVTAVPSFGTGPYTYAWSHASGATLTITSAAAAATTFSAFLADGEKRDAIYQCVVTDSLSATGTGYVYVYAYSSSTGGQSTA